MSTPGIFDITRPLSDRTPVWPGDAPFRLRWTQRRVGDEGANVGELCASTHCGTHTDAPLHVASEGDPVGALPLEPFLGAARVVDVRGREVIDLDAVEEILATGGAERVLFHTGCWGKGGEFPRSYPFLRPGAAARLAEAGVLLVGTDAPSVDPFDSVALPVHHLLAAAGIPMLENLLLDGVPAGTYELVALPLRIAEADASPVRAVLRAL